MMKHVKLFGLYFILSFVVGAGLIFGTVIAKVISNSLLAVG